MSDPSLDALARLAAAAQAMLDAATPGRVDVHRCDADGGAIDYQLQRGAGLGGTVLGYATDHDGSPRAKADATLWANAGDLARGLVAAVDALRAERDRRDALAAAVREYGDALAAEEAARLAWKAGCSAEEDDEADVPTFRGPLTTAYDAAMRRRVTALDALLRGAAAPVVRAEVAPPCAPSTCRSDDDGDCRWNRCPQRLDGEPWVTGRVCPLSKED